VRGIADQREPVLHQRARQMHVERPGGARPVQLDGAQPIIEPPRHLGEKARIVQR